MKHPLQTINCKQILQYNILYYYICILYYLILKNQPSRRVGKFQHLQVKLPSQIQIL